MNREKLQIAGAVQVLEVKYAGKGQYGIATAIKCVMVKFLSRSGDTYIAVEKTEDEAFQKLFELKELHAVVNEEIWNQLQKAHDENARLLKELHQPERVADQLFGQGNNELTESQLAKRKRATE